MSNVDLAIELAGNVGWYIFPCREVPGPEGQPVKASYIPEQHSNATRDQATIQRWWERYPNALIGVSTGKSGLVVADVDVKKGKNGYTALSSKGLELADTFSYETPSGGRHFIYHAPVSKRLRQKSNYRDLEGVDRQTGDSHVIFYAGSAPVPEEGEIADAPAWFLDATGGLADYPDATAYTGDIAAYFTEPSSGPHAGEITWKPQSIIDDARALMHVSNDDVMTLTSRLAYARAEGWPGTSTAEMVVRTRYWETSNGSEREREREWERLMAGAIGIAEAAKAAGDLIPYESYEIMSRDRSVQTTVADAKTVDEPITLLTMEDLKNMPKPVWWVDGLVRQSSIGIVAGAGGLGKTVWMLTQSAHIACGIPFFGREVEHGRILYVASEGIEDFYDRLVAICDYHGLDLGAVAENMRFIETGVNLANPKSTEKLRSILERDRYDLIILDTFSQLAPVQNENDAAQVSAVMREALAIRKVHKGSTVFVVHHANRDRGTMRGSSAFRDNVDTVISMQGDSNRFSASTKAEDYGKQRSGAPVKLDNFYLKEHAGSVVLDQHGVSELEAVTPKVKDDPIRDLIWKCFRENTGKVLSLTDVAAMVDSNYKQVVRKTERWRADGVLSEATAVDGKRGYTMTYKGDMPTED